MAITRTAFTDDDGSGTTGTVINNAVKTELYDQIDAAIVAGGAALKLDDLAAPDDNTDLNASITKHGLLPKLPNDAAQFLNGVGAFAVPGATAPAAIDASGDLSFAAATTLTLASDAITAVLNQHLVDTQSAAATDDLSTITAGASVRAGHVLVLQSANAARVPTVKHNVGNIKLGSGDFIMASVDHRIVLLYDGTNWTEIARAGSRLGAFTPTDASGASLTLAVAVGDFVKIGKMMFLALRVTYPTTANGSAAKIGSLPATSAASVDAWGGSTSYSDFATAMTFYVPAGTTTINFFAVGGTPITNAQLSGKDLRLFVMYPAAI